MKNWEEMIIFLAWGLVCYLVGRQDKEGENKSKGEEE